jgi:hypothetical protein
VSSKAKQKGSKAEREVVKYLQEWWPYAERRLAGATDDKGDVSGVPGVCIEIKDHAKMALAGWIEEMILETKNAKAWTGVVIHKRRGKSNPADWYASMPVSKWVELVRKANGEIR